MLPKFSKLTNFNESAKMYIDFFKYQATGNDFIMIDNRNKNFDGKNYSLIRKMCDRRFGIGADGLILISYDQKFDFEMKYFNSDGKEGSMCGNGGRSAVAFARKLKIINKEHIFFRAVDGIHEAFVYHEDVRLKMTDVTEIKQVEDKFYVQTGSPHLVGFYSNIKKMDVLKMGREIRYSKMFQPEGINVNFIQYRDGTIFIRTYERGVENETHSCGTGSVAAAIAVSRKYKEDKNSFLLSAPGGTLKVSFDKINESLFQNIWLEGPALFVFQGIFNIRTK